MPLATFQRDDRLGEIVIDSPPLNLFSVDLLADLRAAANEAADSDIRALLLRAEGDDFSAGAVTGRVSPRYLAAASVSRLARPA